MEYIAQLAASPEAWVALATLIVMEVVLGIDNLIFISILTNRLPEADRPRARRIGIGAALILRLALLSLISVAQNACEPTCSASGTGGSELQRCGAGTRHFCAIRRGPGG